MLETFKKYLIRLNFQYKEIKINSEFITIKFYSSYQAERFLNIISYRGFKSLKYSAIPEVYDCSGLILHKFIIKVRIPIEFADVILNKLVVYINQFNEHKEYQEKKILSRK